MPPVGEVAQRPAMPPASTDTPARPVPPQTASPPAPPAPVVSVSAAQRSEPAESAQPATDPQYDAAYLNNPQVSYPALSKRMREEGRVMLRVFVSAEGRANQVEISESSGSPRLDRAASSSVARWRFVPARQGERNIASWVLVPVIFKLEG
jgi:protein TonB